MNPDGDWTLIEPDVEATEAAATTARVAPAAVGERSPRWLAPAIAAVVCVAVALAIWATMPSGSVVVDGAQGPFVPRGQGGAASTASLGIAQTVAARSSQPTAGSVVIDIEGAVARPGIHELDDGSRVGDAIEAAGGYAPSVDLAAASSTLNLAARLTDGQQIHVPALGESVTLAAAPSAEPASSSGEHARGLIDLNHASAEQLDTLPGIGPVTAGKIIDARTQTPFTSVDDLQSRSVVGPSTFEKLRDLVTVTP